MSALFKNRTHAGRFLADKLAHRQHDPALLVLALPRGGVPVGNEIARRLQAPLDVFVVTLPRGTGEHPRLASLGRRPTGPSSFRRAVSAIKAKAGATGRTSACQ